MNGRIRLVLGCFLYLCAYFVGSAVLSTKQLDDLRIWSAPENTKIVFDLSQKAHYRVFRLKNPDRVVVDLYHTVLAPGLKKSLSSKGSIKKIRVGQNNKRLRIVFDMYEAVKVKHFILSPNQRYGHRLILDLTALRDLLQVLPKKIPQLIVSNKQQQFIVVIDPGHGGEDPGAIGPRRTKEKDIVLQMAKKLYLQLKRSPGVKPILTRTGDYYIGLQERIALARKSKADLFISLHADAFKNSQAKGASVYTLSEYGASSVAAKWLARKENQSDLMGGIQFKKADKVLASVLLDLSQTSTTNKSRKFAQAVLGGLKKMTNLHKNKMQRANFHVLKALDIPAILIELGFISNSYEERKLNSINFQNKFSSMLSKEINNFLAMEYKPVVIKKKLAQYKGN